MLEGGSGLWSRANGRERFAAVISERPMSFNGLSYLLNESTNRHNEVKESADSAGALRVQ